MQNTERGSAAQRYEQLFGERETFLMRARECARVTIPMLMPEAGHSDGTRYYTPYQSIGARGVNNLASKLLLSLLPPNSPFFRLSVDDFTLSELSTQPDARANVEKGLNRVERAVQNEIETSAVRPPVFETLKQLIVSGNALFYLPKGRGARVFKLDRYVAVRDHMGDLLEVIIKEQIAREALPDDIKSILSERPEPPKKNKRGPEGAKREDIEVYTRFYREGESFKGYQEVEGIIVPGSEGKWPVEKPPIMALRWTAIDGEDYGRSYVEEYLGDLISLEGLSKAIVEASAAAAKVLFMVNPNGSTREKDVAESENLDVITGIRDEVGVLQLDKQADMTIAAKTAGDITTRLQQAFMLNSSVTRQAERVTAEEVRFMIGELEDALGGVYCLLSQEFQLPLVKRIMARMASEKKLPKLPEKVVSPTITTGLEALGRGHDLNKYQMFLQFLQPIAQQAMPYIDIGDMITRVGTSLMIDMDGLVKDQQTMQAEQQQQAQQAQQSQMMDGVAKSIPQIAGHAVKAIGAGQLQQQAAAMQQQAPQGANG